MKDILTAPFMVEMIRTATNMYDHGWDERNGGNISLMLEPEQLELEIPVGRAQPGRGAAGNQLGGRFIHKQHGVSHFGKGVLNPAHGGRFAGAALAYHNAGFFAFLDGFGLAFADVAVRAANVLDAGCWFELEFSVPLFEMESGPVDPMNPGN